MSSPFPGMDPYLERPSLWPDVHHGLISQIQAALNPVLRPRYMARVELRVYVSDEDDPGRKALVPDLRIHTSKRRANKSAKATSAVITEPLIVPLLLDEEIKEARVEIKIPESGKLVTVIEVLSPTNKILGASGRKSFMANRQEIMDSNVHWVEIDLLRAGAPSVAEPGFRRVDYRILVSRAPNRLQWRYWPVGLRQKLPVIGIPLRGKDPDVPLDLGAVLNAAYEHGAYDLAVDYRREPKPPLKAEDRAWADEVLRAHKVR